MLLPEVVSGQKSIVSKGKMRFHRIPNVNKALDFNASEVVKVGWIAAECEYDNLWGWINSKSPAICVCKLIKSLVICSHYFRNCGRKS